MKGLIRRSLLVAGLVVLESAASAQSAPPLTSIRIIRVVSTAGTESIAPTQTITNLDHTGISSTVTTREIGYGSNWVVTMAGNPLSGGTTTSLCGSASTPTTCSPGQTVIGFDVTYNISGYATGLFTYQATSIKAPRNTYSDSITVQ